MPARTVSLDGHVCAFDEALVSLNPAVSIFVGGRIPEKNAQ